MGCNVAFYDVKQDKLVGLDRVPMPRHEAMMGAMMLGAQWRSGHHRIPSPWWVVWDKIDDLGVFSLESFDSFDDPGFDEKMFNRILELARVLPAKLKPAP